jgi:death-on-curing protein
MPEPTRYLSTLDVIALHALVMESTGDHPAPLRDEGALDSAVLCPQMAAYYESADLVRQAATLALGISQAQAFLDGNKRTAFAAMDLFLRLNGWQYGDDPIALAQQLERSAAPSISIPEALDQLESWLRPRAVQS